MDDELAALKAAYKAQWLALEAKKRLRVTATAARATAVLWYYQWQSRTAGPGGALARVVY